MSEAIDLVRAFNDAVNARDLDRLAAVLADDHRFIDSAGTVVAGRAACLDAWRGFFEAFPDYRNVFDEVVDDGDGRITARGRSVCSTPGLAGPAVWHARVVGDRVTEWQVVDPSG